MLRVTKLTDYGIALMTHLALQGGRELATAPKLSEHMGLPLPTVRKILKILTTENLLESTRGVSGGYSLARTPEDITLMDMVSAFEGPFSMTECATEEPCKCKVTNCGLRENWSLVNQLLQNTLESYNLAQMSGSLLDISAQRMQ